jgi:3-hydroxybutyryl-CoA dehydrogenase
VCGGGRTSDRPDQLTVIGYTEVFIPSANIEKVPYFVLLLEDSLGHRVVRNTHKKYQIGDSFDLAENTGSCSVFGVIGTGLLGLQICEFLISSGHTTVLKTRDALGIEKIRSKIEDRLRKKQSPENVTALLQLLEVSTDFTSLEKCDIIIEAAPENFEIKADIFRKLSGVCSEKTIFSTNSSSLSIEKLASVTNRPDKFIGIHFFNPVRRMELVEVVTGEKTSAETKNRVISEITGLNKQPIVVKDSPGYIVNRLLLPQINDAIYMLEEGIATKEDIDKAVMLGLNHPMGPFQLADFIGLDICLSILEVLHAESKTAKSKPAQLLCKMCKEGKLGMKTKEGFYKY